MKSETLTNSIKTAFIASTKLLFFLLIPAIVFSKATPPTSCNLSITIKNAANNSPMDNCTVIIRKDKYSYSRTTQADGLANFTSLSSGSWFVSIYKEGYERLNKSFTIKEGMATLNQNYILRVKETKIELDSKLGGDKAKLGNVSELKEDFKMHDIPDYGGATQTIQYYTPVQHLGYKVNTDKVVSNQYMNQNTQQNNFHQNYYPQDTVVENISGENYSAIVENAWKSATADPLSTLSIDVDNASYSNIRRFITSGQMPPKDAIRLEEMINYFKYDYEKPKSDTVPFNIISNASTCPWAEGHYLVHIGMQGRVVEDKNLPPANLVFLIDVSGSMSEELPLLKESLKLLVEKMRAEDKISLVVYAGSSGLVLPATSGNDKKTIIEALDKLQSGGSTAGGAGIMLAYKTARDNYIKNGNNRVILCTDGDFNVGVSNESDLLKLIEEKRKENVSLSTLGFGSGNYQDAKMELLADNGNGNYSYIDGLDEAKKILVSQLGGTLYTIAKDVKLQLEWNPAYVKSYRLIGYENRMLNKEDFNNDKKDAGDLGSGHNVTALYEAIPNTSNEEPVDVDKLKYQKTNITRKEEGQPIEEMLTIKLRYKNPVQDMAKADDPSKLLSYTLGTKVTPFASSSENLRWAASVASFGMLLRGSEFMGATSFDKINEWASNAMTFDPEGYRKGFITLLNDAKKIKDGLSAVEKH